MSPRRLPLKPKEVIKILIDNGFEIVRQSPGSHIVLKNYHTKRTTIVSDHGNKTIPTGTLVSIERQSGVSFPVG